MSVSWVLRLSLNLDRIQGLEGQRNFTTFPDNRLETAFRFVHAGYVKGRVICVDNAERPTIPCKAICLLETWANMPQLLSRVD
jgi:hypothetical protein